jgi:hypothetical protein
VPVFEGDSDVGWGEVEQTQSCAARGGKPEGPAVQTLASAPGQPSTQISGLMRDGRRVGTWTQVDASTGRVLGRFTLDEGGSGTEEIRDQQGHLLRGAVVAGKREGTWTYYDAGGVPVATRVWAHDTFVGGSGRPPWDPPMVDPADACPKVPGRADIADGCPPASARADAGP